jgi:tRNA nucleotidyltransferase/poly(A) polymerase
MSFKKFILESEQNNIDPTTNTLRKISLAIENIGGEIFVVGGPIRDFLLGISPKDIDFLVRKLTLQQIQQAVLTIGKSKEVGQHFGIVKGVIDGKEYDFAIPRTSEEKTGNKHTDFTVKVDPNASVESDLGRRDFTWNSMAVPLSIFINVQGMPKEQAILSLKQEIIDPNNGLQDLEQGILRTVGSPYERFSEDPLRILRSLQFAVRLNVDLSDDTKEAIIKLSDSLKTVSGERIFDELKKAWCKSKSPSNSLISLLTELNIGETLFGESFSPLAVELNELHGTDKINGQFVAYFLRGGDFSILKPDNDNAKILTLAKNILTDDLPFTYASNANEKELNILLKVFSETKDEIAKKVQKMMSKPLRAKDLSVSGEEIKQILKIEKSSDMKKIGIAQREMLASIWEDKLENTPRDLHSYLENLSSLTEEYFKSLSVNKLKNKFDSEQDFDEQSEELINSFIDFALNSLQISEVPPISLVLKRKEGMTHGYFNSGNNQILVYTKNRAIADFLRSLSHELVHYKQNINNELFKKNIPEVGGEIEDEANSLGGSIIKAFGKENPVIYEL